MPGLSGVSVGDHPDEAEVAERVELCLPSRPTDSRPGPCRLEWREPDIRVLRS